MVMVSHLLPVLEKTSTQHPDADVRIVLQSSELHRATMGSPSEDQGGNKFRSTDEFKVRGVITTTRKRSRVRLTDTAWWPSSRRTSDS